MSTINPFPLNITLKVNSPMLLAYLAQYGEDKFASAEDFNKIFQALDYLHENLDPIGNDFNPSEHDLEEFLNEGADPFAHQSEITGPQNFQSVTDGAGNNETTNSIKVGGFEIKDKLAFIISSLTALRNINWQDKDGTVALLSDLTAIQEGIAWKQPAELLLQYADVVQGAGLPRIPGLNIQGHTLAQGSRVVVTGYNIPYQNGIFRVGSGPTIGTGEYSLSRVADANTSTELNNAVIGITNGTFAGKTYRQTTVNPVINTSPISFVEFGNSTVENASNVLAGIAKLYNAIGNEIDGAITPNAVKTALNLKQNALTNPITGTGTLTKIPKFTGVGTLGDSIISDDGSGVVDVGTNGTINTRLRIFSSALNSYFEIRSAGIFGGINSYGLSNFQMYNTLNSTGYFSWFTQTGATPVERVRLTNDGNLLVNTTTNNGIDKIQVNGTISASPATTSNQVVVKSQLDAKKDTTIIVCSHTVQTFADSTSYFFGINVGFAPTTSTNIARRFEAPFTGNIIDFYVKCISQTVTSSEDVILKINNKTTGLSYTVGNVRYNNVVVSYIFNGFTIPVTKNDSLEFELVVPVLANNGLNSLTIASAVFEKS